jgi:predicted nucleic-acid-binding protein
MRAADTNVLLRIIVRDDPRQIEAAESFIEHGAWVSLLALAETVWNLDSNYGQGVDAIIRAVNMLLSHERLVLQDADVVEAALDLFRSRPSLGFSDCLMLEMARKAGHLPLGTFDRRLARVPGAVRL